MMEIAFIRTLSGIIACFDVGQWEQRDRSHGRRDKSADRGRAYVVGWARVFGLGANCLACACVRKINENNASSAVAQFVTPRP